MKYVAPTEAQSTPKPDAASDGVVIAGYLMAILMPILGLIVGIVLMAKNRMGHGMAVMTTSVFAFFIWLAVLAAMAVGG
jgi:hypothetical protein